MKRNAKHRMGVLATALGVATALVSGMLFGPGYGRSLADEAKDEKTAASDERIEMTMFRLTMPNVIDLDSNDFTKYIEEKTNIHWTFQTAGMDNSETQVNLAMSTSPLPDAFLFSTPNVARYGVRDHLLLPLEDLIDENMPNLSAFLNENPEIRKQMVQIDGHIYGLPSINQCYHCSYRNKMWVNIKHLEELGMEVPKTTEEFKAVLKAYKDKHPEGIGIAGSTDGWGQQFYDWISNAFFLDPGTASAKVAVSSEGKIFSTATLDEYREALKYMNELYSEGYIYEAALTQNHEQLRTLMNESGEPVLFAPYGTISDAFDAQSNPEAYAAYRVIEPIEGPGGKRFSTHFKYDGVAENKFVLSVDCKDPKAALRWADNFYTVEGYLAMQFGADEGTDWVMHPEGEKGLDGEPALYQVLNSYSSDPQNHDWQDIGLNFATVATRLGMAMPQDVDIASAEGLEKLLFIETRDKCEPYGQKEGDPDVLPALHLAAEEADQLQLISEELTRYIEENRLNFITGVLDVNDDAAWQNYIDGFESYGLPTFIEIYQQAYDRWNKG
ncbi:MAG: extracellular solute-binding protein [Eubacteriales bacterium]|nr:extracellular solute-binding protein [Eubacteriales bacterium]